MKKALVLFLFMFFSTGLILAENTFSEAEWIAAQNGCENAVEQPVCDSECFLCTKKNADCLFREIGLNETQICTAMKIQEKYELETLSINERINCEKAKLKQMKENCGKYFDIKKQKRVINELKRERNKICECYEKQFKMILSDKQIHDYNKYKKCD
ncbi:hypothetical protein II906_07775 [bacterium]|nr:hypothetical protein [bacterium]